jgi:FAD/FMN-containing dehydrogenase
MLTKEAASLDEKSIQHLRSSLRGELLRPGEQGYHTARRVWNAMADRRPALIARCAGVADVIRSVNFVRQNELLVSVRSSGHNVTGNAVCDDGLVIDLSAMKGIRVDPASAIVRAQAGVLWGELDHETQAFGLATTGAHVSTIGIAGVTLGGGYGWLMRKYGLAVDNLRSVDIVTADGQLLTASASAHADLFWGVRGGGGNFGIVTSFEYQLHAAGPIVTGGTAFYPVERMREVLQLYRMLMDSAPDELTALLTLCTAPPLPFMPPELHGVPVAALSVCHLGSPEETQRDLAVLNELGPPLVDRIGPLPYTRLQRLFDAAGAFGHHVYIKSDHLAGLDDDLIATVADHFASITSPLSVVMISSLGGAVGRVGENDTAFSHRHTAYDCAITSLWADPRESERHIAWTDHFWHALRPFSIGVYVNELDYEGEDQLRAAYNPATFARLAALKNVYDPTNLFRLNPNIQPSM